jgi:hypothetical protein
MSPACTCTHLEAAHDVLFRCRYCHCKAFAESGSEYTVDLRAYTDIALERVMPILQRNGCFQPFFVLRLADGDLLTLEVPKGTEHIMNSGEAKDKLFGAIREQVHECGVKAVVLCTDGWQGRATAKGLSVPREEFLEACRERGFESAVKKGWLQRSEAILVTVQIPERVMIASQFYDRDEVRLEITYRERTIAEVPTEGFHGRQKMYGDLRAENLK